ncbi:MAG: hypothetical protein ACR2QH_16425 [Geminicoccaceae bacterium]
MHECVAIADLKAGITGAIKRRDLGDEGANRPFVFFDAVIPDRVANASWLILPIIEARKGWRTIMLVSRATEYLGAIVLSGCLLAEPVKAERAAAATVERAILVLDASGSMWGQIEGVPKITIAREVIDGLLQDWDPSVELGVTAYGHREKGNCADIETLVPVGPTNRQAVIAAIDALNP